MAAKVRVMVDLGDGATTDKAEEAVRMLVQHAADNEMQVEAASFITDVGASNQRAHEVTRVPDSSWRKTGTRAAGGGQMHAAGATSAGVSNEPKPIAAAEGDRSPQASTPGEPVRQPQAPWPQQGQSGTGRPGSAEQGPNKA